MDEQRPKISGIGVQINGSVQTAIEEAGALYRLKYGRRPTHLSLPAWIMPDALQLWDLHLGRPTGADLGRSKPLSGMVIVGHACDGAEGPATAEQMELFDV